MTMLRLPPQLRLDGLLGIKVHVVDQEKCIKCGTCFEVCPAQFAAVTKISGKPVPPPLPEEKRIIVRKAKEVA